MGNREGKRPDEPIDRGKGHKRVPSGGEPGKVFGARCLSWWDNRILPLSKSSTNPSLPRRSEVSVLAVTHGAVIQTLLYGLIAARNYKGQERLGPGFYNTSISVVRVDPGGKSGEILHVANIDHLIQPGTVDNPDLMEGEDEAEKEVEADAP